MIYDDINMSVDTSEVSVAEGQIIDAYQLFDDAVFFGSEVARIFSQNESPLDAIIGKRFRDIVSRANEFKGYECVYSGKGYKPDEDFEGDAITTYGDIKFGKGVLNAVYLSSSDDMKYVSPSDIGLPSDDEGDEYEVVLSVVDDYVGELKKFRDRLEEAPEGLRLFAEFVVRKGLSEDAQVHGVSLRGDIDAYHIVDLESLELVEIKPPKDTYIVDLPYLGPVLEYSANTYRKTIQSKGFRNASVNNQRQWLDNAISNMNEHFKLDRFVVMSEAQHVYIPGSGSDDGLLEQCFAEEVFIGKCLRVGCLESQLVSEGTPIRKRKGNINSYASLCAVVEVEDQTRSSLGIDTNIVWIPLFGQVNDLTFMERSVTG